MLHRVKIKKRKIGKDNKLAVKVRLDPCKHAHDTDRHLSRPEPV